MQWNRYIATVCFIHQKQIYLSGPFSKNLNHIISYSVPLGVLEFYNGILKTFTVKGVEMKLVLISFLLIAFNANSAVAQNETCSINTYKTSKKRCYFTDFTLNEKGVVFHLKSFRLTSPPIKYMHQYTIGVKNLNYYTTLNCSHVSKNANCHLIIVDRQKLGLNRKIYQFKKSKIKWSPDTGSLEVKFSDGKKIR